MQAAIITSGIVTNVIEVVHLSDWPGSVALTGGAGIGWGYNGSTFTPPSGPSLAQQAQAMINTGMPLISSSTSSLNGTYPCDAQTLANENGTLTLIAAGLPLPQADAYVLDTSGVRHVFTVTQFKNYCQVKAAFMQTLHTIIGSNSGTLPSTPVVIP